MQVQGRCAVGVKLYSLCCLPEVFIIIIILFRVAAGDCYAEKMLKTQDNKLAVQHSGHYFYYKATCR